ncbi:hypothetical protein AB0I81_61320 [Nonomuraea sp. NPDC050404]|uniref:hypothetical protein n=1 Tax=Nonomuraea sp. NPDC050404 TaxID=3155783 RepID=UPI0033BFFEDA
MLVLITLLAWAQSSLRLSEHEDPQGMTAAMWRAAASRSDEEFNYQLIGLAIFTAAATVVFGVLAWKARRGARRPTVLFAVATGSTAVYVALLWQVYVLVPPRLLSVSDSSPIFHLELPGWYAPLRGVLALAGAVAQISALILLTGGHTVDWWTAHQRRPARKGLWLSPPRQAALLMVLTPVSLLVYAVANYPGVVVGVAMESGELWLLPGILLGDLEVHAWSLGMNAIPVVVAGVLLWRFPRQRLAAGLLAGPLALLYMLFLLDSALHTSDTSYFHNDVGTAVLTPWWHWPVVTTTGLTLLLLHLAALALLFRAPGRIKLSAGGSGSGR